MCTLADMSERDELSAAVGRKVRAIRLAANCSQDELAAAAAREGLAWTRAAVASLETGRRRLGAFELLLLPLALSELDGERHSVAELLEDVQEVLATPNGGAITGRALRALAAGDSTLDAAAEERRLSAMVAVAHEGLLEHVGRREAERHAARKLDQEPDYIAWMAYRLWGHGLTEEREARLEAIEGHASDARRRQAVRGHVTRELLDELRQAIEGNDG